MGCCNIKRDHTELQMSIHTFSMKHTSEFNEICLDSQPKGEDIEKKLNSTYGSTTSILSFTNRKDLESAFLIPVVNRSRN
ncbi:hypothetical protein SteCoe_28277 [Stentor coeruleus]|uniref:Uncharacterized protein n=1 Tax=Stentor coeruleus TaxID=5963 RepID=A0A1R2B8U4_9CILI|nr:hypothetical protein SteCoe_28277 [Stentor coeruleus]